MQEEDQNKAIRIRELEDSLEQIKNEKKELEEEHNNKYQLLEQNASNQITYL